MKFETQVDCWRALMKGETLRFQNSLYCLRDGFLIDAKTGMRDMMTFDTPSHWSLHIPTVTFTEAVNAAIEGKVIRRAVDGSKWIKCIQLSNGPFITADVHCNAFQLTRADIEGQWIVSRTP